jgi:hypothetical protein
MTYAREGPGPLHLPADARTFEDFLKEIASPMTHPCQLPPADVPAAELTEWLDWQGRCTHPTAHLALTPSAQACTRNVRMHTCATEAVQLGSPLSAMSQLERVSLTRLDASRLAGQSAAHVFIVRGQMDRLGAFLGACTQINRPDHYGCDYMRSADALGCATVGLQHETARCPLGQPQHHRAAWH